MERLVSMFREWLLGLTERGRTQLGDRRRQEVDAYLATERQEMTLLLAEIARYQLQMADQVRRRTVAEHPGLAHHAQAVMDRLNDTFDHEIRGFARRRPEVWS